MAEERNKTDGYMVEFDFLREGMRQDQRERHGFLAFTLAANGLILGLLMRPETEHLAKQAWFLVVYAAVVTLAAEHLTIRSSQGVATAGAYLRLFIEPHVPGLRYQRRNRTFARRGNVSSSRGFAIAYLGTTAAFVIAWFSVPLKDERADWQTAIVVVLATVSLGYVIRLLYASQVGWPKVYAAWEAIFEDELAVALGTPLEARIEAEFERNPGASVREVARRLECDRQCVVRVRRRLDAR